jgi:cell wall-associated NlpC family hydrolase
VSFAVSGAAVAPSIGHGLGHSLRAVTLRSLAVIALAVTFALALVLGAAAPAAQAAGATEAQRIVRSAEGYLGGKWVYAATGPRNFDCSGLVFRVFKDNDLLDRIGGSRRTVAGFYRWFANRGQVSRSNPRVGDLIVWGDNKHIGIYVGNGMAISTLTSGVKRHGVFAVTDRFKAYLHVKLQR